MTANAIGRMVGEYDTRIWCILNHYVEEARSRMDLSEVTHVGIAETSRAKGHKYVTVFMDLDERRIVFATEGKDAETVKEHWDGVVRWFQTKISNGLLEGMNSMIQALKAPGGSRNSIN